VLTIAGEKKESWEEPQNSGEENRYHLSERRWGQFTRSFVLPREVQSDKIQASYRDGVLTVTIPKTETAKRRRIDVSQGGGTQRVEANTGQGKAA
jgi:HSP20 family protein